MPKAAWWVLISGLSTVAVAALQTMGANWIWTPVVVGLIGVGVKVAEVLLSGKMPDDAQARDLFAAESEPPQSWARKVLW